MSSQPIPFVTPEEYLEFDRKSDVRNEYIFGEIVPMVDVSPNHGRILIKTGAALENRLSVGPCLVFAGAPRISLGGRSVFAYPDLAVVCGQLEFVGQEKDIVINPKVIVEILSPSTRNYDLGDKARLYRALPSVAELVMIEQDRAAIQHQTRLDDGRWMMEELESQDSSLVLTSLGIEIPLTEIYAGVDSI